MLTPALALVLYPLVVLACHRMWNRERVFIYGRKITAKIPGLNCEPCNLFWIALFWAVLLPWVAGTVILEHLYLTLACYSPLRALLWFYDFDFRMFNMLKRQEYTPTTPPGTKGKCKSCQSKEEIQQEHKRAMSFDRRVAIVTDYTDWRAEEETAKVLINTIQVLLQDGKTFVKVLIENNTGYPQLVTLLRKYHLDEKVTVQPLPSMNTNYDEERFAGVLTQNMMLMGNGIILYYKLINKNKWSSIISIVGDIVGFAHVLFTHGQRDILPCTKAGLTFLSLGEDNVAMADYMNKCKPVRGSTYVAPTIDALPNIMQSIWNADIKKSK